MADKGETKKKRKRPSMDNIPQSMQFYKWAYLDLASNETIQDLFKMGFSENPEANEIIFDLVAYIRSQKKKEKEYKENKARTAKDKKSSSVASSSRKSSKAEPTVKEDDDVQILHERRREILQELEEEESDTEAAVDTKEDDNELANTTVASQETMDSPQIDQITSDVPASVPSHQPACITIKQEEPADPVSSTTTAATVAATCAAESSIPAATAASAQMLPIKCEQHITTFTPSINHNKPPACTLSTIAVADDPLTESVLKQPLKTELSAADSAQSKIAPAKPSIAVAVTRKRVQPGAAAPHAAIKPRAAAPLPVVVHTKQVVLNHPSAGVGQFRDGSSMQLLVAVASKTQQLMQLDSAAATHAAHTSMLHAAASQNLQHRSSAQLDVQNIVPESSSVASHQQVQQVKKEPVPAQINLDTVQVKILSTNLIALNKQIDYLNQIMDLAQSQKLNSEFFYKTIEPVADPSPNFSVNYLKSVKKYISKIVIDMDDELNQFNELSVNPLKMALQTAKTEIECIWESAKASLAAHRENKERAAAAARKREVQQLQQSQKSSWQPLKQRSLEKRRYDDAETTADKQPHQKRKRAPLLDTPKTRTDGFEASSKHKISEAAASLPIFGGCAFCQASSHNSIKCHVYKTYKEREERRAELDLCYSCLRPYNKAHRCTKFNIMCSHCERHKGHPALCRSLNKPPRNERRPRSTSFFTREDERIERVEESEDDGAEFSPSTTPLHEEEAITTDNE